MSKKDLYEIPDEEFVKLVKEFIADVGIKKMFKNFRCKGLQNKKFMIE